MCDVTKVAACGIVATGRLGRVGEIVLMRSHNFMRSSKLVLNRHPSIIIVDLVKNLTLFEFPSAVWSRCRSL